MKANNYPFLRGRRH